MWRALPGGLGRKAVLASAASGEPMDPPLAPQRWETPLRHGCARGMVRGARARSFTWVEFGKWTRQGQPVGLPELDEGAPRQLRITHRAIHGGCSLRGSTGGRPVPRSRRLLTRPAQTPRRRLLTRQAATAPSEAVQAAGRWTP